MARAARAAFLYSQKICAIFGQDIASIITSRRDVINLVTMPPERYSEESLARPGQDTSSVIFTRRVNIIGLVVNLQENLQRYSRAAVLLHYQEGCTMPRQDTSSGISFNRRVDASGFLGVLRKIAKVASMSPTLLHSLEICASPRQDMSSGISFNREVDVFRTLGMVREIANMASISPTFVHSIEICASPGQDMSSVMSVNRGVGVFGILGRLREIANMSSIWPTLQYSEPICAMLGQEVASTVSFERRVCIPDCLGVLREIVNGASRASALFHCQRSCAIPGQDIFGSSRKNRVTRHCYSVSLSSNSSQSLNMAEPETFCPSDLDRKNSESKMALIEKGPINPLDIQSGKNGQNKDNSQEPFQDALVGNRGGMERIVAQWSASVQPDDAALKCACIELERVATKNVYEKGRSKSNRPENAQGNATGYASGDENCDLNNHTKNLTDGCLVSDSEDEDHSWLCDSEAQNNSQCDSESDHDGMYGSDSENDSVYQSDNESDLDQAEEDYFMELLQGDGQDHPVNQPHYDLMPHWLPGYILHAHAAMNPQGDQPDPGPPEEAPAGADPHHLPLHDAQDQPLAVNGNGEAQNELPVNGAGMNANGEDYDGGPLDGPEMPAMAQPVLPQGGQHPQQGNPPQQQAQATGPLNRLRAAARYVRRKLSRNQNPVPMYVPGAPREERTPVGLEEAPALVGVPMIPHEDGDEMDDEAQPRGLFACFTSLFRRHGNPVQEYALQAEQVQEFEEQIPLVEPEMDVLEEDMPVIEELVEGAEPQIEAIAHAVEAF